MKLITGRPSAGRRRVRERERAPRARVGRGGGRTRAGTGTRAGSFVDFVDFVVVVVVERMRDDDETTTPSRGRATERPLLTMPPSRRRRRRRRRDRRAVESVPRAFVVLFVLCARLVAADEYASTVARAISSSRGLQAIGAVDGLLEHLRMSLCGEDEAGCELYEKARKDLWLSLGRDAICGVGEDEEKTWTDIDRTNTQGGFAALLSLCSSPWLGDLEAEVVNLASTFLAQASLTREDVIRVIEANDVAAERNATTAGDDLTTLHPSYVPELAPVATKIDGLSGFSYERPVVVTAVPPLDEDARGFAPDVQGIVNAARAAGAKSDAGVTEAFPSEYAERMEGIEAQRAPYYTYLDHPYAKTLKCRAFSLDDDVRCADRVIPEVGYTHDADGTRLLDVFGRALSGDFVDDNQPSSFVPQTASS